MIKLHEFVNKLNSITDPSRSKFDRDFKGSHRIVQTGYVDPWVTPGDATAGINKTKRLADQQPGEDEANYDSVVYTVSEGAIIVDNIKYNNVKTFKSEKEAEEFIASNPGYKVISRYSKYGEVHVISKKNKGKSVAGVTYSESFAPGSQTLGDGSTVSISEADAKTLNTVFLKAGMTEAKKAQVFEGLTKTKSTLKAAIKFAESV